MSYSSKTNTIRSGHTQYTRTMGYASGFSGVDVSAPERSVSVDRLAACKNVYKDYHDQNGACVQTFPGWRGIRQFSGTVYGIYRYGVFVLVHAGQSLFAFKHSERDLSSYVTVINGTLEGQKSNGFESMGSFWLLDGTHYWKISYSSLSNTWSAGYATASAYAPTLYVSHTAAEGSAAPEQYEQRNMLSQSFSESFVAVQSDFVEITSNPAIKYQVISNNQKTCRAYCDVAITGTELVIPGQVRIGDSYYTVVDVDTFTASTNIQTLVIGDGVKRIKANAFAGFTGLTVISFPSSLESVGAGAFAPASAFSLYIEWGGTNSSMSSDYGFIIANLQLADGAFASGCPNRGTVYFTGSLTQLQYIKCSDNFTESDFYFYDEDGWTTVTNSSGFPGVAQKFLVPIYSDWNGSTTGLTVKVGGTTITTSVANAIYYGTTVYDGSNRLYLATKNIDNLFGKTVALTGTLNTAYFNDGYYRETYANCIGQCTICCEYDGRIFFTGNSIFPNRIWYTQRDLQGLNRPDYVGELNYWTDGAKGDRITGMMSYADILIVLTRNTAGAGGAYIHTASDSGVNLTPRIYPSTYGSLDRPSYCCRNFRDDPVFVTDNGLDAIGRLNVNLERAVEHRSSNVDPLLTREDLTGCKLEEFDEYLFLLTKSGNVYLADSRQTFTHVSGNTQYEWFLLDGFGSYSSDEAVYVTDTGTTEPQLYVEEDGEYIAIVPDTEPNTKSIADLSEKDTYTYDEEEEEYVSTGETALVDDEYHLCYATGERTGGTFQRAIEMLSTGGCLYFGTVSGKICCLNTDKRGVAYNGESVDPGTIHRHWYDRVGHRYTSSVTTRFDDCAYPHVLKNTVPKSVDVHIRAMTDSNFSISFRTDRHDSWESEEIANRLTFFEGDFANLAISSQPDITYVSNEKERLWEAKQYYLQCSGFRTMFGIYHIVFRWHVCRRIKN